MTKQFFCADACRTTGELPIGMASTHKHYVLVECPPPWPHQAPQAKRVPDSMRKLIDELKQKELLIPIKNKQEVK